MATDLKSLLDYLSGLGIEKVPHTQKNYLGHLVAVYRFVKEQGCEEDVCLAGLFHSIYGTESFQGFKLPLESRPELRTMIGDRAERLAYWNCAMLRQSFDDAVARGTPPFTITDRITGKPVELTAQDFDDLCRVHLYDWLEQVPRSEKWGWSYRRDGYRRMAERLGPKAVQAYERTYAQEAKPAGD